MKNRLTLAIATLVAASMGTVAFAQTTPHTPPQNTPQTTQQRQSSNANKGWNNQSTMNNNMSHSHMSNSRIEQKIKHELTSHGVTATNVHVSFRNGTATLSGTVATRQDINKAKMDAKRVQGVKHVNTRNLHVRSSNGNGSMNGNGNMSGNGH